MSRPSLPWVKPLGIIIFIAAFWLGVNCTASADDKFPASTFLPFAGEHALDMSNAQGDRWIYPLEDDYLQIGYQQSGNYRDIVIQKLDEDGQVQWKQVYERDGQDTLVIVHSQENAFVMAIQNQLGEKITSRLIQCDSNGSIVWQRELPVDRITAIASTNDKGLIVAGVRNNDIHVFKIDGEGIWKDGTRSSKRWDKVYKESGSQTVSQILQVLDEDEYNDGYILVGSSDGSTNGKKDVYMMRLDAYGETKWSRNYGTSRDDEGISVVPMIDDEDKVTGFLVSGYTVSADGDQDIYLIYVDIHGVQQPWPGYRRTVDGLKERSYGGGGDQKALALVAVPDSFMDDRKWRGEDIEGHGGGILVGVDVEEEELLIVRIDETGHVLWEKNMDIPGEVLLIGTLVEGDGEIQELAYSVKYPGNSGQNMEMYVLQAFLEGVIEDDDKTIPQDDQIETNGEAVEWEKRTLKYEALRDISKELKDLLAQQPQRTLTATSGWGEIEWPDLSYYLGALNVGKADGEGTLVFTNGVWYKGQWKNNMFNGTGMLRFPSGEVYQGEFVDHMMHGQGVFTWPSGESYRGGFKLNKREGKGIFTWPGGVTYEGDFAADAADGQGVIRWASGEYYEGQMSKGQATGQGSYYFPDGEWYRGEFQNLAFHGIGVYHWPNGSYYVGEFKSDRLHGEGYYVWPNGVIQWGYWKEDRYLGTNEEAMDNSFSKW